MPGEALARSKELFRILVEQSTDAIMLISSDGIITYVNPATAHLTGYTLADLEEKDYFTLVHPDDQENLKHQLAHLIEQHEGSLSLEYHLCSKDGTCKWIESTITNLLLNREVEAIVCHSRDITQRKQLLINEQNAHAYAERKFRSLADSNIVGMMVTDQEGKMYEVNNQLVQQLGYSKQELLSGDIRVKDLITSKYQTARARAWRTLISQGASLPEEKEYIRKDGSHFPALVAATTINEERTRALVMLLDISERREAEQRKQEFLSMVSHELRTPLTAIQGFLELMQLYVERLTKSSSVETNNLLHALDAMLQQTLRQTEIETRLVAELLDVSRMEMQKFEIVLQLCNLTTIVQQVVASQQQIASTHTIELELPSQTHLPVEADPDRIEQVLTNYLSNALKYSPPGQNIRVHLSVEGFMVRVSIRDQGPGLTFEHQQRVWERFYQVKDTHHQSFPGGLGLGLYIVRTIIAQHQGQVGVDSQVGQGATFWFMLPLTDEPI
ncbi:MAG: PAS domain S-box protein [Ktedonobacteraceae bacterium]|nr:PAS domain S-box protein [Ktedonobacteraceae bacterium]